MIGLIKVKSAKRTENILSSNTPIIQLIQNFQVIGLICDWFQVIGLIYSSHSRTNFFRVIGLIATHDSGLIATSPCTTKAGTIRSHNFEVEWPYRYSSRFPWFLQEWPYWRHPPTFSHLFDQFCEKTSQNQYLTDLWFLGFQFFLTNWTLVALCISIYFIS